MELLSGIDYTALFLTASGIKMRNLAKHLIILEQDFFFVLTIFELAFFVLLSFSFVKYFCRGNVLD